MIDLDRVEHKRKLLLLNPPPAITDDQARILRAVFRPAPDSELQLAA